MSLRFRVALSFPGEYRPFVSEIAEALAGSLGREQVLYDAFHEAEFARPDLDNHLLTLYHNQSELIVVFLCAEYNVKEWCGLEMRVVRDLIKKKQSSKLMLLRFDDTEIPGLLSIDGWMDIRKRTPQQVVEKILERLPKAPTRDPRQRIATSRLPRTSGELFGREAELARLASAWTDPGVHLMSIVAWGGAGKTSLVSRWVAELARRDFDGADYFDWSFYSQGTRDQSTASADTFVDTALRFFGDPATADSSMGAWEKGSRLAELVGQRRTLLVLDGLEPLQHPPGPLTGELKDPAIRALLRRLAARNAGLCIVTTREAVAELAHYRSSVADEWMLDRLSEAAGLELLSTLGVEGSLAELKATVEEVDGHALTLNLLGRFLTRAYSGDVRKRDRVELHEADAKTQSHGHAFRAMAAYERWLAAGDRDNLRQLAVLRLLGLFDRPALHSCLAALRAGPPIVGLTEPLLSLDEADWNLIVADLVDCGLVTRVDDSLDAHPLIREYFALRLQGLELKARPALPTLTDSDDGAAWREAHGRLFDFLQENTRYQPATLTGLQPLYQAVYHGCLADRGREALYKVFVARILRGTGIGSGSFYTQNYLGAFGADLAAISCFFEKPWSRVSSSIPEANHAWLLSMAGFNLRALGRLREAVEPMRAGLVGASQHYDWTSAATFASNMSELEIALGELPAAAVDARQSVVFADRGGDAFERSAYRTALADALHQSGEANAALEIFIEAERIQADWQPHYPRLYALQGFRFHDFLLAKAESQVGSRQNACEEIEKRAVEALEIAEKENLSLLSVALGHLGLGRARLQKMVSIDQVFSVPAEIRSEIENAVVGLRVAGVLDHLPRGLLFRAWMHLVDGNVPSAQADLDEAAEIAERGSMRLHLADVALCRARFFHDRAALTEARRLVEACGYGRRLPEIEELEALFAENESGG